ncbi:hypothetical protein WME75_28255 [Sorangium sp. So ce1014]|uniref:hypothetical protein n=1 Tax=Sorangium sp. So ce1014 TaxID=3133326 RepID=UPI003F62B57A
MRNKKPSRFEAERAREAERWAAPPRDPTRPWRVVVNGGSCGEYDEAGARAEFEAALGRSIEIPREYYRDSFARITKTRVELSRWDGNAWVGVPDASREIVVDVHLSGKGG